MWQAQSNAEQRAEVQGLDDEYFEARYKKEKETGESHDGMSYFSKFDVEHYGAIEGRVRESEKEGETFRNDVLPRILNGLLASGQVQKVHDFLLNRRAIHNFRGYPRELEAKQCVDVHVRTAQTLLDPANEFLFDGDNVEAFKDLATFSLSHAQFPQFGAFQLVPRLAPIRKAMIEQGLTDPWEIFISQLDHAMREFSKEGFGAEFIFNGIRRYLSAARAGEVEDLRTLRDWPEHALVAFDMVERNPSIPSGLAWLIPAVRRGNMRVSASDSFQSSPILGKNLLLAITGNEDAIDVIKGSIEPVPNALDTGIPTIESALKLVTKSN